MITYGHAGKGLDDILYYNGRFLRVEWYRTADGRLPALEYYLELAEIDRERFGAMVMYMADNPPGTFFPQTYYRIEDKDRKIYVFKPRDERFFNFTTECRRVIVTNAYHKHSQKMTKADLEFLEVAVRYRAEYLRRVQEGRYYED